MSKEQKRTQEQKQNVFDELVKEQQPDEQLLVNHINATQTSDKEVKSASEWLINLIKLNPMKMNQIFEWIEGLLALLTQQPIKSHQNISSLNFHSISINKHVCFLIIHPINNSFYLLKLRHVNGSIIHFQINEPHKKQAEVKGLLGKIGKKVPVFIFDHTQDHRYIQQIILAENLNNIVYITKYKLKLSIQSEGKKVEKYVLKESEEGFYYHYLSRQGKRLKLTQNIQKCLQFQANDQLSIRQILNISHGEFLSGVENNCFLANIIRQEASVTTKDLIADFLKKGLEQFKSHCIRWQNQKTHFPGPNPQKDLNQPKDICNYCRRKRTQAICKGCSLIYDKKIMLCVRNCFQMHHEANKMFMSSQSIEICKNITFFNLKYSQLSTIMGKLISEQSGDSVNCLNYIRVRILNSLNKLMARRNGMEEEAETNQ